MSFDLGSILQQYAGSASAPDDAHENFGRVAQVAPPDLVRDGLSAMFRSDQTPSVGQMAAQTWQQSSPTQQAGMLNEILSGLSPDAISSILGSLANRASAGQPSAEHAPVPGSGLGGILGSVLSTLGGGPTSSGGLPGLGAVLGQLGLGTPGNAGVPGVPPTITPDQASQLSPEDVRDIANKAEEHNPGIVDVLSNFYVQHPDLVKSLGAMALAVAMGHMAKKNS